MTGLASTTRKKEDCLIALQQPEEVPRRHGNRAPLGKSAANAEVFAHPKLSVVVGIRSSAHAERSHWIALLTLSGKFCHSLLRSSCSCAQFERKTSSVKETWVFHLHGTRDQRIERVWKIDGVGHASWSKSLLDQKLTDHGAKIQGKQLVIAHQQNGTPKLLGVWNPTKPKPAHFCFVVPTAEDWRHKCRDGLDVFGALLQHFQRREFEVINIVARGWLLVDRRLLKQLSDVHTAVQWSVARVL
mmetsp:Transcript_28628/g.66330  ORF Transcript_28628/g.66330 Transcript_28628/m.66330 type:complete len:244 (-) Transcript_28628:589-1320(-)